MDKKIPKTIALLVLAFLLFLAGQFMLAILPVFGLVLIFKQNILNLFNRLSFGLPVKYIIAGVIAGIISEILAFWQNLNLPPAQRALFHPELFPDIILGLGFYIAWALVWFLLASKFKFRIREVFITAGIFGIFAEQFGAVFLSIFTQGPAGLLKWVFVFLVYGSMALIPFVLFKEKISPSKAVQKAPNFFIAFFVQFAAMIVNLVWVLLLGSFFK